MSRLNALIQAYRSRPESRSDQSLWQFVRERDPYVFSHHPAGAAFRDHVWEIGGLYFCKGCVVTFAGAIFGGIFFAATRWLHGLTDVQAGLVFVLLLLPTLLAHGLRLPRWFRHLSRFLLGILMISAVLLLVITDSWLVRVVIVASYFGGRIPLERKRNRENREVAARSGGAQSSGE